MILPHAFSSITNSIFLSVGLLYGINNCPSQPGSNVVDICPKPIAVFLNLELNSPVIFDDTAIDSRVLIRTVSFLSIITNTLFFCLIIGSNFFFLVEYIKYVGVRL